MSAAIRIWALPSHLRVASERAAKLLRSCEFDALFLSFSRDLEEMIEDLAKGAPFEYFTERLAELKLVPEPLSSWELGPNLSF